MITDSVSERITEVIVSGMEVYILHSFSQLKPSIPWFTTAYSRAMQDREVVHKRQGVLITTRGATKGQADLVKVYLPPSDSIQHALLVA
ncbi:hypothetical protein E2C01_053006 [Portunus trituberculatus]|uniref:Uncharacterized protein n=1 Tax=Portunus trituberculatus TaxID=210409 RepID=A0A5B7GF98_PORTR|nr:hypothetical protein [Portunus trituberculatus]